jgi:biopolymer transport protein ExbD
MQDPTDIKQDGKLDLVPMIDCIMLLLLFFILTTRFTAEEKVLAALLPTKMGQQATPVSDPKPPTDINVVAYPDGLARDMQPSQYQAQLDRLKSHLGEVQASAIIRVGGSQPFRLDGAVLTGRDQAAMDAHIAGIHAYLATELAQREVAGSGRQEQPPITIHCFSGLPWKYAAVLYDGVRAYEKAQGARTTVVADQLADQRPVSFAPPRLRNVSQRELGDELYDLLNLR